jgi:beta-mannosidase
MLECGWRFAASAPTQGDTLRAGAVAGASDAQVLPEALFVPAGLSWQPALVPGTAASSLRALGQWSLDAPRRDFDAEDWWYELAFEIAPCEPDARRVLGIDGLATLASVWIDGQPVLRSDDMFLAHEIDISALAPGAHVLTIRFRSLRAELQKKRARPRWRTPMVTDQQLRWLRTTLLGRTPGWSPPAAAVGPWRPVWIEERREVEVADLRLRTRLEAGRGIVEVDCDLTALGASAGTSGRLLLARGSGSWSVALDIAPPGAQLPGERPARRAHAQLVVPEVEAWWPHTHGEPACYEARLELLASGAGTAVCVELGPIGFRTVQLDTADGGFALSVNGVPVFCRGACWSPADPVALAASDRDYPALLGLLRDAGMNMLRVGGTMTYETDAFYEQCDAAGILVWQDFMFANMDYPDGDAGFCALVQLEAAQQLARLQGHPALAILCGNSEASQQAAMWGAARERWSAPLFTGLLAAASGAWCSEVPFVPSSASGGSFPHAPNTGASSYYGVGAYLREPEDARRANVRFASECLAFANVPAAANLALVPDGGGLRPHHPRWKERVPRDLGAGWDFDDVRDHYLERLHGMNAAELRALDPERYLQVSRVVTGRVMALAFEEWRRAASSCRGALIWFLRDLWPGAGWGVVDSGGAAKAALHVLAPSLQPVAVFFSDEGLNGLCLHVVNETPAPIRGRIELQLHRDFAAAPQSGAMDLGLPARANIAIPCTDFFEGFLDINHAYRFGPRAFELVAVTLRASDGRQLASAQHVVGGSLRAALMPRDAGLRGEFVLDAADECWLRVSAQAYANAIEILPAGWQPREQFFDLAPGGSRLVRTGVRGEAARRALGGRLRALNGDREWTISPASAT